MKFLKVIGFLFGAAFLLVAGNHFFNPQYEADSMLILLLALPLFFITGIEHYQAGRKKTAMFSFIIVGLSLILWISSPFIAWP
ncbi:hypothetical protein [Planococcus sp. CAU13]|uniref:hypothetical protein n=1 Tax=Planococcus sp. CAU13 TaxID=1541197 RepID=UPI00052FF130|nr:hypothetical protein [Planococcus sp. CAU13]